MALEVALPFVDSKTVAATGTPEALTTREVNCSSVFIQPLVDNTNPVFIVDKADDSKTLEVGSAGITLPITDPRLIFIDVTTNDEGVEWVAV